jgi:heme exporter protein B
MSFWKQVTILARHELLLERRAGETWSIILPFAMAALIALPLGIGLDQPTISRIGPAAYWAFTLLFGMQIAWRQSSTDTGPTRDAIVLSGVDPAARFAGRSLASGVLILGFMVALGVLTIFFYSPPVIDRWAPMLTGVALFAIGLAQLSTLAAEITAGLSSRPGVAPLLVAPLATPLLIGAAQLTAGLTRAAGILVWLLLLVLVDLILAITGVLTARPLEESAA